MAKIIDELKAEMLEEVLTESEIDCIMERKKYYPVEVEDDENEEGVLKYSNRKSEIWIKYIYADGEYLVSDITMKTKKRGSTTTRPLTIDEIKLFMDYFRDNEKYDEFMMFIMELFLARRIGDTLSLEWGHFYYENGNKREVIDDLIERKTDKIAKLHIANIMWKYIDWYCKIKNINPTKCLEEDIFKSESKVGVEKYKGDEYSNEYVKAIKKQSKAFRYRFVCAAKELGIERVSTHSIRKSFGNLTHKLNLFDPDCLETLKTIYVHDSVETTKIYVGIIDEKAQKYFNDVANLVFDKDNGIEPCIDNIPVVALRTNDLRDILLKAYNLGIENCFSQDASVHMEIMSQLISDVEKRRIS